MHKYNNRAKESPVKSIVIAKLRSLFECSLIPNVVSLPFDQNVFALSSSYLAAHPEVDFCL